MSVIIRLQNLPWSANAGDIRSFFKGLGIPDGGVHIVGGENGDAFIAFSTDEDARQAMALNGGRLKETQVSLLLSSRAEMQKVIEAARQQTISFMSFSTDATAAQQLAEQKAAAAKQVAAHIAAQAAAAQLPKPQPPVITSSSLSGILAQQMFQQHQLQFMSHSNMSTMMAAQNPPLVDLAQSTPVQLRGNEPSPVSEDRVASKTNEDRRRGSRSRSKSRERRSRRSRSRERSSRRRRSRSSERRSSRKHRDRSRDRSGDRGRTGSSRGGRGRSSYDRDQSSSGSIAGSANNSKNANNVNMANIPNNANMAHNANIGNNANIANNGNNRNKNALWDGQQNAAAILAAQAQPPPTFNQPPPMDMFATMGNVPIMNPLVQPPIIQFPFGSPPPMIPPPIQRAMPIEDNVMNSVFPNAMPYAAASNVSALPADNQSSSVRITNMDSSFHYSSIRKFFSGLHIPKDGIKIINDEFGIRRGDAVIRFAQPFFAQRAVEKSGPTMKIFIISDEEYNKEIDSFKPPRPHFNDRHDNFNNQRNFNNFNNHMNSTSSVGSQQVPPPVIRFQRQPDTVDEPLDLDAVYNRTDQFGRRIRTEEELAKVPPNIGFVAPPALVTHVVHDDEDDVVLVTESSVCTVLLIEDLPSFTSEQDIMKMFSDFTLLHIVLARQPKNFHAYVKFLNKEDAAIALKVKYNHRIGHKQVYVSECSDQVYELAKSEYSIDPIPMAQFPVANQIDDNAMRKSNNTNDDSSNKYPQSQLFQNQFDDPNPSSNMPFNVGAQFGNGTSNMQNANVAHGPSQSVDPSNKFEVNHSDPRRRKQFEQCQVTNQQNQQDSDYGHIKNPPPFGESDQNTNREFGGSQHQFEGFKAPFHESANNSPHNQAPFNRQPPNNSNNNFQPQRPNDPRQKQNPFIQTQTQSQTPHQQQTQHQQHPQHHEHQQQDQQSLGDSRDTADTPFLYISNIDFRTAEQEIRDWFAEISVYPKIIYRLLNFRGAPNGNYVCQFNTPQEANRGLVKNGLKMRSRIAYLRAMPVAHAAEALASVGVEINTNDLNLGSLVKPNNDTKPNGQDLMSSKQEPNPSINKVPKHRNPFMQKPNVDAMDNDHIVDDDLQHNDNQNDVIEEDEPQHELEGDMGNGDGNLVDFANADFDENDDANNYQANDEDTNGPIYDNFDNNGPPFNNHMTNNLSHNNQQFNRGGNNMMMGRGNHRNMSNTNNHPPPSQRNTNGCIVALRNVPFQASAIDILRFFGNFQLGADDIIRRYRDDGSPTGDARVCFASPMDAMAAVDQCQNGRIMNRTVQMRLFS